MGNYVEDMDDLKDIKPVVAAQPATPVATPAVTPAPAPTPAAQADVEDAPQGGTPAKAKATPNADDYNVEFGDEKLMSRSDGLDILRPDKGKTVRFALLTDFVPAKRAFIHYIKGKGTYHCLGGEQDKSQICCTSTEESQPQIVALVIHYTNANQKTGRYDPVVGADGQKHYPPIQWEIKFVRLSRSAFRRVSNLVEEDGKPTDIDITMNPKDGSFGYEYNKVSPARWKRNPELVKEVEAAIKQFADGKKLFQKLGKKATQLEFRAVLAGTRGPSSDDAADLNQIDDI